jgi:hypothetical protein
MIKTNLESHIDMEKIIHNPKDIVVGKLYKTVSKQYQANTLYLGCSSMPSMVDQTPEKFLVIVMCDLAPEYIGIRVIDPTPDDNSLWAKGFYEQDTNH